MNWRFLIAAFLLGVAFQMLEVDFQLEHLVAGVLVFVAIDIWKEDR